MSDFRDILNNVKKSKAQTPDVDRENSNLQHRNPDDLIPLKNNACQRKPVKICPCITAFIHKNPLLYSISSFLQFFLPTALGFADIVTDVLLLRLLQDHPVYYSMNVTAIVIPLVAGYTITFRWIERWLGKNTPNSFQTFILSLYCIPPVGIISFFCAEVFSLLLESFSLLTKVVRGQLLLKNLENAEYRGFMRFRRVFLVVGESLMQTVLCCFLYFNSVVLIEDLAFALATSVLNLIYNGYIMRHEAKKHGYSFVEHVVNVILVRDIPIQKLPPLLGRIKRGNIESLNYAGVDFDDQACDTFCRVIELHNDQRSWVSLKKFQLSLESFIRLSNTARETLLRVMKKHAIDFQISRFFSLQQVQTVFQYLDRSKGNNDGFLDQAEYFYDADLCQIVDPKNFPIDTMGEHVALAHSIPLNPAPKKYLEMMSEDDFNALSMLSSRKGSVSLIEFHRAVLDLEHVVDLHINRPSITARLIMEVDFWFTGKGLQLGENISTILETFPEILTYPSFMGDSVFTTLARRIPLLAQEKVLLLSEKLEKAGIDSFLAPHDQWLSSIVGNYHRYMCQEDRQNYQQGLEQCEALLSAECVHSPALQKLSIPLVDDLVKLVGHATLEDAVNDEAYGNLFKIIALWTTTEMDFGQVKENKREPVTVKIQN